MIAKTSERECLKIEIHKNDVKVYPARMCACGCFLKCDNEEIYEDKLINLTELLGVLSYAQKLKNSFIIYDLSFSHLCPKQIKTASEFLKNADIS